MNYDFKRKDELIWAVVVSAAVAGLTMLVQFNANEVTDWKTWAVAILSGMVRAAAGAAVAVMTRKDADE